MKKSRKNKSTSSSSSAPCTRAIINKVSSSRRMDELPTEVIQEILARLPLTSLFESRYVCQSWRGLIKEPRLSLLHYIETCRQIHPTTSLILCAGSNESHLYHIPDFYKCKQAVVIDNFPYKNWVPFFKVVGSCNGFICVADDSCRYRSIFVCNPVNGDCSLIPEDQSLFGPVRATNFGFGYHREMNEYKVLRLRYIDDEKYYVVEIHTIGTRTWRNIGKVKKVVDYLSKSSGVLVNGSLHWLGILHESEEVSIVIISLADEKVQDILPISIESIVGKIDERHHLGELGGSLIIVDDAHEGHVNVWVMKEYGNWGSWTKQFTFERPSPFVHNLNATNSFRPLVLQENGEILVEVNCGALFVYNTKWRKHYRKIQIKGLPASFKAVPHMGTLVKLENALETPEM